MAVCERLMRRRAQSAVGHAELEINIVPCTPLLSGEIDLVPASFHTVVVTDHSRNGAVEIIAGAHGESLAGGDLEAGVGVAGYAGLGGERAG